MEKNEKGKMLYGKDKKPFSLMIASAFYEVKAYSPYIMSLLDSVRVLHELGIDWTYKSISGDSYVDRAKNSLVHDFLKSDYSHIFMIDSDEAWNVDGFCRIIKAAMAGAEIVGAAYPCKNNWEFFGCIPKRADDGSFMGKEIGDIRLLDMWGIPGGFLIYSRDAIERTRPNLKSRPQESRSLSVSGATSKKTAGEWARTSICNSVIVKLAASSG